MPGGLNHSWFVRLVLLYSLPYSGCLPLTKMLKEISNTDASFLTTELLQPDLVISSTLTSSHGDENRGDDGPLSKLQDVALHAMPGNRRRRSVLPREESHLPKIFQQAFLNPGMDLDHL